jgi:diguanylate cyclase
MESPRAARPAEATPSAPAPAQLAKEALRRLALDRLEPTPDNYARAYAQESGEPAPASDAAALATLIGRIARGIERGGKNWTAARKKDSLNRVLEGSRSDAKRLQQRLTQLVASWDGDTPDSEVGAEPGDMPKARATLPAPLPEPRTTLPAPLTELAMTGPTAALEAKPVAPNLRPEWTRIVVSLGGITGEALPAAEAVTRELAQAVGDAVARVSRDGASLALATEIDGLCQQATRVLQHRHHLVDQLGGLCRELAASITDLAEDESWARGQSEAIEARLAEGLNARSVRSVGELLRGTRERQAQLRGEREAARNALKGLINRMLSELGELGSQTGRFHESVGRYADTIERADSLESLAGAVREMVEESRTVSSLVQQTQARLHDEHARASELSARVNELEVELRRLSDEVSTDPLTQVANRRGLAQAFDAERARMERSGSTLSIGLLDIDNFKRLNDELGHAAGDQALKSLAAVVSQTLRPTDRVARYGGEEFVVLLPDTPADEGQQILTRLQRSLTGGLFMHESRQVFVTFSAGVTAWRPGERIEDALERADQALYEAKRTGKNRTCLG